MAGALVRSVQPAAPAWRRRLCAGRGGIVINGKDQDGLSGFRGTRAGDGNGDKGLGEGESKRCLCSPSPRPLPGGEGAEVPPRFVTPLPSLRRSPLQISAHRGGAGGRSGRSAPGPAPSGRGRRGRAHRPVASDRSTRRHRIVTGKARTSSAQGSEVPPLARSNRAWCQWQVRMQSLTVPRSSGKPMCGQRLSLEPRPRAMARFFLLSLFSASSASLR